LYGEMVRVLVFGCVFFIGFGLRVYLLHRSMRTAVSLATSTALNVERSLRFAIFRSWQFYEVKAAAENPTVNGDGVDKSCWVRPDASCPLCACATFPLFGVKRIFVHLRVER